MNKDTRDILAVCGEADGPLVLATVTAIEGSSYRRPGARMLAGAAGRLAGSVSGGCLERDLVVRGAWLAEHGPRLVRLDTAADADETELAYPGCGGVIEILVERVSAADPRGPLALLQWIADRADAAVLATVTRSTGAVVPGARAAFTASDRILGRDGEEVAALAAGDARDVCSRGRSATRTYATDSGDVDVFLEYLAPRRRLLIAGRHHDVKPLVELATLVGWHTTVAASGTGAAELGDPDAVIPLAAGDVATWAASHPGGAVILMTHSLALDRQLLAAVIDAPDLAYLGLLGPRHRADDILGELARERAVDPDAVARLRAPVGLDLGGDGPEAVALSIVADLQATWSGRTAARLGGQQSIHADIPSLVVVK